jgi:cell division septation protein DedD
MSDETGHEEQSHYEISLTAGQAFVSFVLLLLSLAASFAFGLMIGRGQGDDRLVVRKVPPVVTEASVIPKKSGKIVELGVADDDFRTKATQTDAVTTAAPVVAEGAATTTDTAAGATPASETPKPAPASEPAVTPAAKAGAARGTSMPAAAKPATQPSPTAPGAAHPAPSKPAATDTTQAAKPGPVYAQLLSIADQKTAEALAAKLIDRGFTAAYVDRTTSEKGPIFRVRVLFSSEADARAAEPKLKEFAKDVWIVK